MVFLYPQATNKNAKVAAAATTITNKLILKKKLYYTTTINVIEENYSIAAVKLLFSSMEKETSCAQWLVINFIDISLYIFNTKNISLKFFTM